MSRLLATGILCLAALTAACGTPNPGLVSGRGLTDAANTRAVIDDSYTQRPPPPVPDRPTF